MRCQNSSVSCCKLCRHSVEYSLFTLSSPALYIFLVNIYRDITVYIGLYTYLYKIFFLSLFLKLSVCGTVNYGFAALLLCCFLPLYHSFHLFLQLICIFLTPFHAIFKLTAIRRALSAPAFSSSKARWAYSPLAFELVCCYCNR